LSDTLAHSEEEEEIDGALVAGESLDTKSFAALVKYQNLLMWGQPHAVTATLDSL
jgi:triosephosphate isomerase